MRKLFYTALFLGLAQISLAQQDCKTLPTIFKTEAEGLALVEKTHFEYLDSLPGQFSSTLGNAKFYSCNRVTGYLILMVDGKKVIHKEVATRLWNNFKFAKAKDDFYDANIRNRFPLIRK